MGHFFKTKPIILLWWFAQAISSYILIPADNLRSNESGVVETQGNEFECMCRERLLEGCKKMDLESYLTEPGPTHLGQG